MLAVADSIANGAVGSKCPGVIKGFIRELLLGQTSNINGYAAACTAIAKASVPAYDKITTRTYIIAGEEDKTAPLAGCETIKSSIIHATVSIEVLPEIGHWLCIEAPNTVSKLLLQYLS